MMMKVSKLKDESNLTFLLQKWNLTVSINIFALCIRNSVNKEFFFLQGYFVLYDDLGTSNDGQSCVYFPREYKELETV
jgi:hypothetical protein